MNSIVFYVPGMARTQGSKRTRFMRNRRGELMLDGRGNPVTIHVDSADWKGHRLKKWKRDVATAALAAATQNGFRRIPLPRGVAVQLRFIFPRPRRSPVLEEYVKQPDLDKLERACIDAMAGVIYEKDRQVCSKVSEKDFQRPHDPGIGVVIAVSERRKLQST